MHNIENHNEKTGTNSFANASKLIEDNLVAQNIIMSLDKAIKWENKVKKEPFSVYYMRIYERIEFIKHIVFFVYLFFIFFEIPSWCINNRDIQDYTY